MDPDFWGYLNPALGKLNGGAFQKTHGRDCLYPGIVFVVLRLTADFRAIAVVQYLLGVLTAGLMLLAWQRAASLTLGERRASSWPVRLAGLLPATTYLTARSAVLMEHSVRPEAVFLFFVMTSIGLNLELIRRRWVTREYGAAAWLGATAAVLSVALYQLKPSFGFAVLFVPQSV